MGRGPSSPPSTLRIAGDVLLLLAPTALGYAFGGVDGAFVAQSLSLHSSSSPRTEPDDEASSAPQNAARVWRKADEYNARLAQFLAKGDSTAVFKAGGYLFLAPDAPWTRLPLEQHCITIAMRAEPVGSERIDHAHPLLLGAFNGDEQLRAIERADGGYARIHVVNLRTARTKLRRLGEGVIEEGCYLLHPKREDVIVPLKTYHSDMLQEMTREAKRVLGLLGAKQLTIETTSGVSLGGEVVSNLPFRSGDVTVANASAQGRETESPRGAPRLTTRRTHSRTACGSRTTRA